MAMSERLDVYLCRAGLAESREKARKMILAGHVAVNGKCVKKPAFQTAEGDDIKAEYTEKYVGRGGYKLERALSAFNISVAGVTACDVGASTGGFTDCLLQNGAARVYAVDVGCGQLHDRLRGDGRVVCMEKTNFRDIDPSLFCGVSFACADVSFISLRLILPSMRRILPAGASAVTLVKPQFETGGQAVGKNGVVRSANIHREVLRSFIAYAADVGFFVRNMTFSPITGAQGNIEYLAHLTAADGPPAAGIDVNFVVKEAFAALR